MKITLESAKLTFNEIKRLKRVLNHPEEETHMFIEQLSRGINLVEKCTTIPLSKKYSYSKKLEELDECIGKFFSRGVQGSVAVNTLRNGVGIQEINDKIDFMFKSLNISYEPLHSASCGEFSGQNLRYGDVGFDQLLQDKEEEEEEPVDVVVSGPGGHGRTTSAIWLHDPENPILEECITKLSELCKVIPAITKQQPRFKNVLKTLESTVHATTLICSETEKLNRILDRPREETHHFIKLVTQGVNLVYQARSIKSWNLYKSYVYSKKLEEFEISIVKFFNLEVTFHVVNGLRRVNSSSIFSNGEDFSNELDAAGFLKHLKELKEMILHDKEPVTVLSAPGGCGKSTLARKLCRDPEIQRMFGKNILLLNVSELANITAIVQEILKCLLRGSLVPDFQNDDDAIMYLECFQKAIGPRPILLVLDDVCRDIESLIEKLTFALPNYKILLITRLCFLRFSHVYHMNSQNDQPSMTHSCQSALPKYESSEIPDDQLEESLDEGPEVVWRREEKILSDGKSTFDAKRMLLDRLPTSPDDLRLKEMKDCSGTCWADLRSSPEHRRITATTYMHTWGESAHILDLKDMDCHINLVEPSHKYLHDISCKSGKHAGSNMEEASHIRKGQPGVVIRELSSDIILSKASQVEATSTGGKGKEKVIYMPKKKALETEGVFYSLD